MKAKATYTLTLETAEIGALKKLLGKYSVNSKKGLGLTESEAEITSQIYDLICDVETEHGEQDT